MRAEYPIVAELSTGTLSSCGGLLLRRLDVDACTRGLEAWDSDDLGFSGFLGSNISI